MSIHAPVSSPAPTLGPLGWIGRRTLEAMAYLGGAVMLTASAVRSLGRPHEGSVPLGRAVSRQVGWMIGMGLPLAGLVHIGLGSFLSMQSFFGGTFADGTGAIVGVGLVRNIAPLMSALTLAGLFAARMTPALRARAVRDPDGEPGWWPDREAGQRGRDLPDAGRLAAVRILAAMIVEPVVATWSAFIGIGVGWLIAVSLIGLSTNSYFHMFFEMIWIRDIVGVIVKGMGFGFISALLACHEGLREGRDASDADSVAADACRAACLSGLALLLINNVWFTFVYLAGPAFGPTLLAPPAS